MAQRHLRCQWSRKEHTSEFASTELTLTATQPAGPNHALVGREREAAEIVARQQQPDTRLLTLVGFSGMSKTRRTLIEEGKRSGDLDRTVSSSCREVRSGWGTYGP